MEETYKRENEEMVKLVRHEEKMLTNQEIYNHWGQLSAQEVQFNQQLRRAQAQLDRIREAKEKLKKIAKDCERRLPKRKVGEEIDVIPSEVKNE
ncbi:hypothetical protein LCGC14_3154270 [marine sediment metagenome]|uniref:Uncharacterized protein n=1 Tax=marine sediment metagenome TaxID=412755 RepID=A0A0F8WH80_9ZZZZ